MANSADLLREFTGELVMTGRLWRRMVRDLAGRFGMAEAGLVPFLWIGRLGEGVRQNQIAELSGIESASLVRVLDDLGRTGLVVRRQDPADRRANLLEFTEQGRALFDRLEGEIEALRRRVLDGVAPTDIEAALRVFAAIKQAAGRTSTPAAELAD